MPAWKNRDAGRRGRSERAPNEADRYDDGLLRPKRAGSVHSGREHPSERAERLTRTATSMGDRRERASGAKRNNELEAVASELDRLLSKRNGAAASGRRKRAAGRPEREVAESRPRDEGRLDQVIGALEKLDRKVEGMVSRPLNSDHGDDLYRPYDEEDDHGMDDVDDDFDPQSDYAYDDDEDDYGQEDHDEGSYAYADPRSRMPHAPEFPRKAERHNRPAYASASRAERGDYTDLGRRIDALRKPQVEAFNMVRQELGSLRDAIGGYSTVTQDRVGKQNAELRRLANMVERLRVEKQDDRFAKEIRKEVAELKSLVGRTNVDGTLKTLEHGYAHILQRLDELTRASIDPRVLRGVTARLNEIEDAFATLPRGEHMLVLEDRIGDISDRLEELLHRHSHDEIEPLRAELRDLRTFIEQIDISGLVDSIDDRMKFVSGRLDDLEILAREQQGLDTRLTAMEERLPDTEMLSRLQGRLEDIVGMMSDERASTTANDAYGAVGSKLEEIAGRLDRMEQSGPQGDSGAFQALEERLSAISGKIDAMEKKASRPMPVLDAASAIAAGTGDAKAFGELQNRIADLSRKLERPIDTVTTSDLDALRAEIGEMRKSVATPASTEMLEKRISDLAEAVSRGSNGLNETRLEQLGSKVAALATQLEQASDRNEDLERVSTALARIEEGLKASREDVVSVAREAAREAVSSGPTARSADYDAAIEGLQTDLRRLLEAAEGTEERTLNTFNGVQSVLGSLTDRLERLEKMDASQGTAGGRDTESGFIGRSLNRKRSTEDTSDRPNERVRDRKADFIAAARRAAQAASEEAAMMDFASGAEDRKETAEDNRSSERAGWLRGVLKRGKTKDNAEDSDAFEPAETAAPDSTGYSAEAVMPGERPAPEDEVAGGGGRRRALLFAAAAVVLTIGALQVFKLVGTFDGSSQDQAAVTAPETVTPAPVTAEAPISPEISEPEMVAEEPVADDGDLTDLAALAEPPAAVSGGDAAQQVDLASVAAIPAEGAAVPGSVQAPATAQPAGADEALAFAPPSSVNSSFGEEAPGAGDGQLASPTEAVTANLVTELPPAEVGTMALRNAAATGNPAAAFLIGVRYTEGTAIPANLGEAAKWYRMAADKGLAPAQYRLASLYEKGRGVERDLQMARELYLKAAEAGNAKAMHNLAVLYAEGADGNPDFTQAARWFESAANYGVKDSLFNLGILYARGLGVEKDLVASYKWFAIAADQGDRDAAKKRDDVANMMDQDTLANARSAVESFTLKVPSPAANKVETDPQWASTQGLSTNASAVMDGVVNYQEMVLKAQSKLNQLGFETGTPDGQMGPRTRSAIRAFQRSLGREETGEVDADLIKDLESQAI